MLLLFPHLLHVCPLLVPQLEPHRQLYERLRSQRGQSVQTRGNKKYISGHRLLAGHRISLAAARTALFNFALGAVHLLILQ